MRADVVVQGPYIAATTAAFSREVLLSCQLRAGASPLTKLEKSARQVRNVIVPTIPYYRAAASLRNVVCTHIRTRHHQKPSLNVDAIASIQLLFSHPFTLLSPLPLSLSLSLSLSPLSPSLESLRRVTKCPIRPGAEAPIPIDRRCKVTDDNRCLRVRAVAVVVVDVYSLIA